MDKHRKRVETKGKVLWVMRGLPKRAEELWWYAEAHQPACITSTDQGLLPQLQNWLQNDSARVGDGVQVSRPAQDEVQLLKTIGLRGCPPSMPHLPPSSSLSP